MGLIMNDANAGHGEETSAPEAGSPKGEPAERDAFAVVEALNAENSQLKDRVLRTLAEMENLRRRTEREVADAKTYGVTGFARDMLIGRRQSRPRAGASAGGGARPRRSAYPVDDRRRRTDRARS